MDAVDLLLYTVVLSTFAAVPVFITVLLVTRLGRRWLAPWARHALWSLVLLRLLMPVSVGCPGSLQTAALKLCDRIAGISLTPAPQPEISMFDEHDLKRSYEPPASVVSDTPSINDSATVAEPPAPPIDWRLQVTRLFAPVILTLGMIVTTVWTAVTTRRLTRRLRSATACLREEWLALLAEGRGELGIRGTVALKILPGLSGPATCGWWRPTILLPESAVSWSASQMRHVVLHELAHISRHDVATNWIVAAVRILHWWNPIFWIAHRAWLVERELACDATVLSGLKDDEVRSYGNTLLQLAEGVSAGISNIAASAPGFVFFRGRKRAVQRRLRELRSLARPERSWHRWISAALILAFGVSSLTDAGATERGAANSVATQTPFELPAGTTWKVLPATEPADNLPVSVQTTDISRLIARRVTSHPVRNVELHTIEEFKKFRADPTWIAQARGEVVQQLQTTFRRIVRLSAEANPAELARSRKVYSSPAEAVQDLNRLPEELGGRIEEDCEIRGDQLVIRAKPAVHKEIEGLIKRWSKQDRRMIQCGITLMETPQSIHEFSPGPGATVVCREIRRTNPAFDDNFGSTMQTSRYVPTFLRIVTQQQADDIVQRLQRTTKKAIEFTPKVTTVECMASLFITTSAPVHAFVTGVESRNDGSLTPRISTVAEVSRRQIMPILSADEKTLQLVVQFETEAVTDVQSLQTSTSGRVTSVQVPQMSHLAINVSATVPEGHSLLVVPLGRNSKGNLPVYLIKPELKAE